MYVSKYYTCEEIDQRLLQGYYDDSLAHGFVGTLKEFWAFFLSIANKVDKKEGWDLSENNFSDELLEKLNGIEEHANYVTKVSQLHSVFLAIHQRSYFLTNPNLLSYLPCLQLIRRIPRTL